MLMYATLSFLATPLMLKNSEWLEATRRQWLLAIISGVLSGGYIFSRLESIKYIEPVDMASLIQTQLIFVIILARIWLKELIGIYEVFFITIILTGTFLVTQPQFLFGSTSANDYHYRYIGILLSFTAAVLSSIMSCIVRSLHTINPYLIAFLQGIGASVTLLIYGSVRESVMPSGDEWLWILLGAVGGALCVMLFTFAYKMEEASLVTAISALETIITVVLQIIVLHVFPNWITVIGAVLTMVGVMALALKKQILGWLPLGRR